jgi:hypothetical protein
MPQAIKQAHAAVGFQTHIDDRAWGRTRPSNIERSRQEAGEFPPVMSPDAMANSRCLTAPLPRTLPSILTL